MNFFGNNNLSSDNKSMLDQFPRKHNLQRYIQIFSGLAFGAASSFAFGLGLGEIEPKSFLGQPLAANIGLISLDGDIDPATLIVRQVSRIEAEKMGVDIFQGSYTFEMKLDRSTAKPKIIVVSKQSINEPYLNLLVELRWPSGVVYREYPVLLDPPPLVPVSSLESKAATKNSTANQKTTKQATSKVSEAGPRPITSDRSTPLKSVSAASGKDYKVKSGDTLWQIAKQLSEGTDLSIRDTMAWVHKNNPGAFSNGDMNRLKAGANLKMPDLGSFNLEDKLLAVPARALADSEVSAPLEPVSAQDSKKELEIDELKSFNNVNRPEQGLLVVNSDQTEDQSRELIDMLTRENEDLKQRMKKVENSEYLDTLKKLVTLQKRQISELRTKLGVRDTSSEEMSALLEQADVDFDAAESTVSSSDVESELSTIEEQLQQNDSEITQPVVDESSQLSDSKEEASLVNLDPPLVNPPETKADKSLVTWLVVGAGAFLAMIFAFLLIYYRKMSPSRSDDDYDDSDDMHSTRVDFNVGKSHSGSFYSSSESSKNAPQERAPDIGYDGDDTNVYPVNEDGDWLGEKVDDLDVFDAGAFDTAIQEVEDIFESISLDENAIDELEGKGSKGKKSAKDKKQPKVRSEDEVRSSIAEKMSQYNPRDFKSGIDGLGLLEIDDSFDSEEQEESDEIDATINRAKMFCEFSQYGRARDLIQKSMGELPDSRYTAALEYIEQKQISAEQEDDSTKVEGFNAALDSDQSEMLEEAYVGDFSGDDLGDEDDSTQVFTSEFEEEPVTQSAAVLMDKFDGDLDDEAGEDSTEFSAKFDLDDATEVLAEDENVAGELLEDALASDLLDGTDEDHLDLDLDIALDFDDADLDHDIQIDDLDDERLEGKKKPVSC